MEKLSKETPYKIEKGIPLTYYGPTDFRYPLKDMEVGDSFCVGDDKVAIQRCRYVIVQWKTRHKDQKVRFALRKGEDGLHRCWRIE